MRRRRGPRAEGGLTLVEIMVSAGLAAVVLGLGISLTNSSTRDSNAMYTRTSLSIRTAETTDRIVRELQIATMLGEDLNGNRTLDNGEDTNRNGRLDADWSLRDGAAVNAVTVNLCVDGWMWSGPVSYFVSNGTLMRRENGLDQELCRGVTSFQLTRSGNLVDVDLTAMDTDRSGTDWTETSSRRAYVRN